MISIQQQKLKVLFCSESTKVSSGFGIYNKHLIQRLYDTNKYDIAEFAAYGLIGDKEKFKIPWKYYPNAIQPNDKRIQLYNSAADNAFGKWRFDRVVADFKPHVVIDLRDYWMSSFEKSSAFRKYFHWILMPTIDSSPQKDEWLDTYVDADAIFTYSDWGANVLKEQTNNNINYIATTSPSANDKSFIAPASVKNKQDMKKSLVINPEHFVIGTVMRNQKRKLFPELIKAFEKLIEKLEKENSYRADKTVMYFHTSYPDAGWDMAQLISDSKVSDKIYFTYCCKQCSCVFASKYAGFSQNCYSCGKHAAIIPNVSNSLDDSALGKIMSTFDVYIQYAICEGFGMPQIEAAFCGVPVVTVNYSAMEDVIDKLDATSINIATKFRELETGANRVYPDIDDTVEKLYKIVHLPSNISLNKGKKQLEKTKSNYSWDNVAQTWSSYLDTLDIQQCEKKWDDCQKYKMVQYVDINSMSQEISVYENIFKIQNLLKTINLNITDHIVLKMISDAERGYRFEGPNVKDYKINDLVDFINKRIDLFNKTHMAMQTPNALIEEDYITYANQE